MSNILQNVKRGRIARPQRVIIYGPEGVGKTTLASQFPAPLFLDVEDGTAHLDVPRLAVRTWVEMEAAVREIAAGGHDYKTLVVDSVDWAEKLATEEMLARDKKSSIEDYGYGKGYVSLSERMARWLASLDSVITAGIGVLLIGHSKVNRYDPPDGMQAYDRYELRLSKQVVPLVKEWADALLFANYKTRLVEAESGRTKAIGGKERIIRTQRTAACDAKCRVPGVPEEIPMTWEAVTPIVTPVAEPTPAAPAPSSSDEPSNVIKFNIPPAPRTRSAREESISRLHSRILEGRPELISAATRHLIRWGWLAKGQTLSDLLDEHLESICSRPDAFREAIQKE